MCSKYSNIKPSHVRGTVVSKESESVEACAERVTQKEQGNGSPILEKGRKTECVDISSLDSLNESCKHTLIGHLGICFTKISETRIEATMPVNETTCQPYGLLHGGATLALGESIAGVGTRVLSKEGERGVGMQVSGNHVSSAVDGDTVLGVGTLVHKGRSSHVWNVDVFTSAGKLVSTIRVINSILTKR